MMARMSSKPRNRALSSCDSCGSRLVQPTDCRQGHSAIWEVELRCADCQARELWCLTEAELEKLDREQDRATEEIQAELRRLEGVHMEQWVAQFAHALEPDLIGPDDFRARG
jgi:hypothetical protein